MTDAIKAGAAMAVSAIEKLCPPQGGARPVTDRYPFHSHKRCSEWTDGEVSRW